MTVLFILSCTSWQPGLRPGRQTTCWERSIALKKYNPTEHRARWVAKFKRWPKNEKLRKILKMDICFQTCKTKINISLHAFTKITKQSFTEYCLASIQRIIALLFKLKRAAIKLYQHFIYKRLRKILNIHGCNSRTNYSKFLEFSPHSRAQNIMSAQRSVSLFKVRPNYVQ